jgi:RNA polymerase sigma-70 factor (sigma-E family)
VDAAARDADWEAAFAANYDGLLRFGRLLVEDRSEAEELVQEAFARLYQRWDRLENPSAVQAYLRVTVLNLARGGLRRRVVARRHHSAREDDAPSAERQVLIREGDRAIVAAVGSLPRRQRECIVLRYYLELSVADTASMLRISPGAVKAYTHRALAELGRMLGQEEIV